MRSQISRCASTPTCSATTTARPPPRSTPRSADRVVSKAGATDPVCSSRTIAKSMKQNAEKLLGGFEQIGLVDLLGELDRKAERPAVPQRPATALVDRELGVDQVAVVSEGASAR